MKILKRYKGYGQVFDTDNPDYCEPSTAKPGPDQALHQHYDSFDYNFLRGYFPENHPIFIGFGQAYYYTFNSKN